MNSYYDTSLSAKRNIAQKVLARPEIEKIFFLASAKKANDDEYVKWKALGGE